jgi:hypothetical protein
MRSFAKDIITQAAVAAGLDQVAVMDKPDKETILLPEKRIQLEYLPQGLERSFKRVARATSTESPESHRTIRARIYKTDLTVRAEIKSNDETWLETFVNTFLVELPHKVATPENDLVTVEATRAVRGGFGKRTVEVFKKRSNALHITFKGMICKDREVPLITDVNIKDGTEYQESAG